VHRNQLRGEWLYIAWKLETADASGAATAMTRLVDGEGRHLYRLRSWVIVKGEAHVLLAPMAPLEQIAEAIWTEGTQPLLSRWVAGERAGAATAREIETAPVDLGLASRPEQWPLSSAASL
jgi:hypothetical protein